MKKLCFRFDVDSYLCAFRGVPNLVKLAKKNGVHFTFFYNMGRGIHIRSMLKANMKQKNSPCAAKFSNIYKLGLYDYIKTSLINPMVGTSYPEAIKVAHDNGHEIGLHGGINHGDWMRNAHSWDAKRIEKEVDWGLSKLSDIGITKITSFSSPGWVAPPQLSSVLSLKGFNIIADRHGHRLEEIVKIENNAENILNLVPTNLLGEPGGVGYIENLRASQMGDTEIIQKFRDDLEGINQLAVIYDHPYYAGIKELSLLEAMIHEAKSMGFHLTTFNKLI